MARGTKARPLRRVGPSARWDAAGEAPDVDVFGEWLESCDGSRLPRAVWASEASGLRAAARGWRSCAARLGLALRAPLELLASIDAGANSREPPGVVVVSTADGERRSPADWLRLGLSRAAIVGVIVAPDGPVRWPAWPPRAAPAARGRPLLAVAEASDARAWGRRSGRDARSRTSRWRAVQPDTAGRQRGLVLADIAGQARRLEADAVRICRARQWRAASRLLAAALRLWLAAGLPAAAVRVAVRLAWARLQQGEVLEADRLAVCAEVAAHQVGRHGGAARLVARRVELARRAAHARAWQPAGGPAMVTVTAAAPARASVDGQDRWPGDGGGAVDDELIEVLQAGHHEEDYPAIARVCSVVRDRLGASAVAVVALGEPAPLAGAGRAPLASDELVRKATGTVAEIAPTPGRAGVEAAVPVRFAGAPVGVLCCRWGLHARVDEQRARTLMAAAASVCAPNLHALLHRRPVRHDTDETLGLLGVSAGIARVRDAIRRAAAVPFAVLVEGESGSGKELVARAIHRVSGRQRRPLCAVNCAAISDELFEAEVFGHARGAFTGALSERAGLFEEADGGTLFLDEIAELSLRGQAKLLRVLQEGEVRRLGENVARRVDVRFVAASNRPLEREVAAGRFRDDLRFRLDVVRIAVPPLRDRAEDVPLLADHFWRQALERTGGRARLDEATLDVLSRYQWPGNVRELQNLMATLAVRAPARGRVRPTDLPVHVTAVSPESGSLDEARRHFDARFVRATLVRCGGRRAEAARKLGLSRQGLAKLVARLGLDTDSP